MYIATIENISFYLGVIGLFFLPFSISLTQLFLYISSILSLFLIFKKNFNTSVLLKNLLPILILYLYLLIISIIQNHSFKYILTSEWKDIFLILLFFWSYYFANSNYNQLLIRFLGIIFLIFLGIGLISSFLPFRLGNLFYHLQHGFIFDGRYRAQHLVLPLNFLPMKWELNGTTYPFGIYMPVGFYGTHLSFGSIIAMISFYFFTISFVKIMNRRFNKNMILLFILTLISLLILFFTQARSSIFGFIMMTVFLIIFLLSSNVFYQKWKLVIKPFVYIFLFFMFVLLILIIISPNTKEIILQTFGWERKHTDYQRELLWYLSIQAFLKNPWMGYGIGNFKETMFQEILNTIKEKPLLWYPLYQTEIMHGHNDLIHFLVIGGIFGAFFYLWFFYQQIKILLKHLPYIINQLNESQKFRLFDQENFLIFLFLPIFLLFAGMFQCYFLSDHTMQFFWILYGISFSTITQHQYYKEENYV